MSEIEVSKTVTPPTGNTGRTKPRWGVLVWGMVAAGVALVAILIIGNGCAPPLDAKNEVAITRITTGWLDAGRDDLGRSKLVPTIEFNLRNISDKQIGLLQLNGIFRRCEVVYAGQEVPDNTVSPADLEAGTCSGEVQEWGSLLVRAVPREGIGPGEEVGPFTMVNKLGYTGDQPQTVAEMLQHRSFVDVKLELKVKHRAEQWQPVTEFQIDRQLLTQ
ncbi:MAG: hypothetical protein VX262_02055 [Acidobacteriota bacterium]|nr:hypothetical protein [Acidobacteriota bacterium]